MFVKAITFLFLPAFSTHPTNHCDPIQTPTPFAFPTSLAENLAVKTKPNNALANPSSNNLDTDQKAFLSTKLE